MDTPPSTSPHVSSSTLYFNGYLTAAAEELSAALNTSNPAPLRIRIQHNLLISHYFDDICRHPDGLLNALTTIVNQQLPIKWRILSHEDVHKSTHITTNNTVDNNIVKINTYPTHTPYQTLMQLEQINDKTEEAEILKNMECEDFSILLYNCAVLHFQLSHYDEALYILEKLFVNVEQIEDSLVILISLILIEIYLKMNELNLAVKMLQFLEMPSTSYCLSAQNDDGNVDASEEVLSKYDWNTSNNLFSGGAYSLIIGGALLMFEPHSIILLKSGFHFLLSIYRMQIALATKQFEAAEEVLKGAAICNNIRVDVVKSASPMIVESATNVQCSYVYLISKAALEYNRGEYESCVELLKDARQVVRSDSSDGYEMVLPPLALDTIYHNNMGCIYFQLGSISLASLCFTRALKCNNELASQVAKGYAIRDRPGRSVASGNALCWSTDICYNIGVYCLMNNKLIEAFTCFDEISKRLSKHVSLWIRLAECCILFYHQNEKLQNGVVNTKAVCGRNSEAPLLQRTVALEEGGAVFPTYYYKLSTNKEATSVVEMSSAQQTQMASTTSTTSSTSFELLNGRALATKLSENKDDAIAFAKIYLHTALSNIAQRRKQLNTSDIIKDEDDDTSLIEDGDRVLYDIQQTRLLRTTVIAYTVKELKRLEEMVLLKLSYISLCVEDFCAAVYYSFLILKEYGVESPFVCTDGRWKVSIDASFPQEMALVLMYAAEGLIELGRGEEGAELMEALVNIRFGSQDDKRKTSEASPSYLHQKSAGQEGTEKFAASINKQMGIEASDVECAIQTNLAYTYILKNDNENAYKAAESARTISPESNAPALTALFLLLSEKKKKNAIDELKQMRY